MQDDFAALKRPEHVLTVRKMICFRFSVSLEGSMKICGGFGF